MDQRGSQTLERESGSPRLEKFDKPTGHRTVTDYSPIEAPDAGIGRAAVKGTIIGFVVVLTIVFGIALAAGAGLISALGVGAYAALWGGPGWGGMVGAVRYADRIADDERNAEAERQAAPTRPTVNRLPARDCRHTPSRSKAPSASPSTS